MGPLPHRLKGRGVWGACNRRILRRTYLLYGHSWYSLADLSKAHFMKACLVTWVLSVNEASPSGPPTEGFAYEQKRISSFISIFVTGDQMGPTVSADPPHRFSRDFNLFLSQWCHQQPGRDINWPAIWMHCVVGFGHLSLFAKLLHTMRFAM